MRPVEKGSVTQTFTHWREARDPLIDCLGNYCSYCERSFSESNVEHKEPKADPKYADKALDWDNFLLACGYCNSIKQDKDTRAKPFLFPDEKNTACAFVYADSGRVEINPALSKTEQDAARSTRDELLTLNRFRDTHKNRDLRWQNRINVWREAKSAYQRLQKCNTLEMREQIIVSAVAWGGFSIWYTVFADDKDMRFRLLKAFTGTRRSCFDDNADIIHDLNL